MVHYSSHGLCAAMLFAALLQRLFKDRSQCYDVTTVKKITIAPHAHAVSTFGEYVVMHFGEVIS